MHPYLLDDLTPEDRAHADRYAAAIEGIPDSFDMFEPHMYIELNPHNPTGGLDLDVVRQFVQMLTDWHTALDTLAADLAGPDDRYSAPAARFLLAETEQREGLANKFHRAVVVLVAGKVDPTARIDPGSPGYCYSAGFVPEPSDCNERPRPGLRNERPRPGLRAVPTA